MAKDGSGQTIGVWIGPDDQDLLEEFDEVFIGDSRSERVKDGMRLYMEIEQALRDAELDDMTERSKRHWLSSMIRTEGRRKD